MVATCARIRVFITNTTQGFHPRHDTEIRGKSMLNNHRIQKLIRQLEFPAKFVEFQIRNDLCHPNKSVLKKIFLHMSGLSCMKHEQIISIADTRKIKFRGFNRKLELQFV